MSCGTYFVEVTKPGNISGSKAIYYKIISESGETLSVFKDSFDHLANFLHRKVKW